jgi:metal-responsive CopG/Arc/MetJ family transcriptional regulator
MSITATPKKRGRPATGKDPTITVRLPPTLVERVVAWGESRGLSRSEAIRKMIEIALSE